MANPPIDKQGLWAWYKGKFYGIRFCDMEEKQDHVTWFAEIGLPDFGSMFDQIVRGRMEFDRRHRALVLSWYGSPYLPNTVYESVIRYFDAADCEVIERFNDAAWA